MCNNLTYYESRTMKIKKIASAYSVDNWWITPDEDEVAVEMFFRDFCEVDIILYKDGAIVDDLS